MYVFPSPFCSYHPIHVFPSCYSGQIRSLSFLFHYFLSICVYFSHLSVSPILFSYLNHPHVITTVLQLVWFFFLFNIYSSICKDETDSVSILLGSLSIATCQSLRIKETEMNTEAMRTSSEQFSKVEWPVCHLTNKPISHPSLVIPLVYHRLGGHA